MGSFTRKIRKREAREREENDRVARAQWHADSARRQAEAARQAETLRLRERELDAEREKYSSAPPRPAPRVRFASLVAMTAALTAGMSLEGLDLGSLFGDDEK